MAIQNRFVEAHIKALFGPEYLAVLQAQVSGLAPGGREALVLEHLSESLRELGGEYVLPFCFKNDPGTRTSHYIIFVSKNPLGYKIMKEIMAKESSKSEQGVPSLSYCPADKTCPLLFELARPLDDLAQMLLSEFAGQQLTVNEIYQRHNVGRPFIESNYKSVIKQLDAEGRVTCDPSKEKRRKNTLSDGTIVIFPPVA